MPEYHLAVVPRDGFFCKDGRDWFTSASGRGYGLEWPYPSTLAGVIRTAWGRAREAENGRAFAGQDWFHTAETVRLGVSLALRRPMGAAWSREHRVWPVPADVLYAAGENEVKRLEPVSRPYSDVTVADGDGSGKWTTLWWPIPPTEAKPERPDRWWGENEFIAWLCGERVNKPADDARIALPRRIQVHVSIDSGTGAAVEGRLFSHDIVETLERGGFEWAAACRVETDETGSVGPLVTLGSDRKPCRVEELPPSLFEPPQRLLSAFENERPLGLRLVLVTPAYYKEGWLIDGFSLENGGYRGTTAGMDLVLKAAFVPRPKHVSGWDMVKNQPKETLRLAPAGSVFFLMRADGKPFGRQEAEQFWLHATGSRTEDGFGRVVPGIWKPKGV